MAYQRRPLPPLVPLKPVKQPSSTSGLQSTLIRGAGALAGLYAGKQFINPVLDKGMGIFTGSTPTVASTAGTTAATTAAGAAPAVPAISSAAMAPTSAGIGSSMMAAAPYALPVAAGIAGTLGAANNIKKGRPLEAGIWGSLVGGPMIGGPIAAGLAALRGSGPHPETKDRRTAIGEIEDRGFLDNGELVAGVKLGNPRDPNSYNIDLSQAGPGTALGANVGLMDPLGDILVSQQTKDYNNPDYGKRRSDLVGMFTNALAGDPRGIREMYSKMAGSRDDARRAVDLAWGNGQIDKAQHDAEAAAIDNIYNFGNPADRLGKDGTTQADVDRANAMRSYLQSGDSSALAPWRDSAPAPQPMPMPKLDTGSILPQKPDLRPSLGQPGSTLPATPQLVPGNPLQTMLRRFNARPR